MTNAFPGIARVALVVLPSLYYYNQHNTSYKEGYGYTRFEYRLHIGRTISPNLMYSKTYNSMHSPINTIYSLYSREKSKEPAHNPVLIGQKGKANDKFLMWCKLLRPTPPKRKHRNEITHDQRTRWPYVSSTNDAIQKRFVRRTSQRDVIIRTNSEMEKPLSEG